MGHPAESRRVTFDEYLAVTEAAEVRHQLVDGEISAMTGGTRGHGAVILNLALGLKVALRGSRCTLYTSDVMVRTPADDALYPDVVVSCSERDTHPRWLQHPVLIVEVLSETTAAFERGAKFERYRTIEELREYVLVDPERVAVDVYRRDDSGAWSFDPLRTGDLHLASVGTTVALADIYEGVLDEA